MANTLWDSFDILLSKAEEDFLAFNFQSAVEQWQKYYKITARTEYEKIITEIAEHWQEELFKNISALDQLFKIYSELRSLWLRKEISNYTFKLYKRLLLKIYDERFAGQAAAEISLEAGVFACLKAEYNKSVEILIKVIKKDPSSWQARIFLGAAYMELHEPRSAIAVLSQSLFLAADQIFEQDLYLSQFKMLYGKLNASATHRNEAAWLLVFESWYRGYLILEEDQDFFLLMQHKEANERILQVKYHQYERYRHFVRCLFLADYSRLYHLHNKGLVAELENYMAKLDPFLFKRYRRKRKELKA